MKRIDTIALAAVLALGSSAVQPTFGAPKGSNSRSLNSISAQVSQNEAAIGANGVSIQTIEADVAKTVDVILEVPELTLEAFGEGSVRWISPAWQEAFADNLSANTTISILNLTGVAVLACVLFYDTDGVLDSRQALSMAHREVGQVGFVPPGGTSRSGWVEIVATGKVLVEGALITFAKSASQIVGTRERTMTWYAVAPGDADPQELCPLVDNPQK